MINILMSCFVAILAGFLQNDVLGKCTLRPTGDGPVNCCSNYFFNGSTCTDCPDGYIGDNCSYPCPPSYYGTHCGKRCNCSKSLCHRAYGCPITKLCSAGFYGPNCSATCPYPSYGVLCNETCDCSNSSCHHVYGCYDMTLLKSTACITEIDRTETTQTGLVSEHYKIVILSAGIIVFTALLLMIGRALYRRYRMSHIRGNRSSRDDTQHLPMTFEEQNFCRKNALLKLVISKF